ncbi:MAG: hypothetical protein DBX52_07175 [Clostridiales bacterium]|nr:MAG: hypothetical protein DBX52_07175 [Clostridiales bacterium]
MFSKPRSYWKIIEYVVLTLVCFLLQSVPAFGVRFLGCAPSLLLLLAIGVAFFENCRFSAWFGLAMGLLSQFTTASIVGLDAIFFMFASYFISAALEVFLQRNFLIYMYVSLAAVALQQLLDYLYHLLIWSRMPFGIALTGQILPTFFFTGICAFPLYGILNHFDRKFQKDEEDLA